MAINIRGRWKTSQDEQPMLEVHFQMYIAESIQYILCKYMYTDYFQYTFPDKRIYVYVRIHAAVHINACIWRPPRMSSNKPMACTFPYIIFCIIKAAFYIRHKCEYFQASMCTSMCIRISIHACIYRICTIWRPPGWANHVWGVLHIYTYTNLLYTCVHVL
jgi:hypothetical protein